MAIQGGHLTRRDWYSRAGVDISLPKKAIQSAGLRAVAVAMQVSGNKMTPGFVGVPFLDRPPIGLAGYQLSANSAAGS